MSEEVLLALSYEDMKSHLGFGLDNLIQPIFNRDQVCTGFRFGPVRARRGSINYGAYRRCGKVLQQWLKDHETGWKLDMDSNWWWSVNRDMAIPAGPFEWIPIREPRPRWWR